MPGVFAAVCAAAMRWVTALAPLAAVVVISGVSILLTLDLDAAHRHAARLQNEVVIEHARIEALHQLLHAVRDYCARPPAP